MLLEAHHEGVHPGVEDHVRAFEAHLRRVARREILHVHRCRDHGAGDAEALCDVPLHLRAEYEFWLQLRDARFDGEVGFALSDWPNVNRWRQAIATMLASPPPPEHLAAFAERIGDRFSEARMIGRYIELFRRLCPHPRAA